MKSLQNSKYTTFDFRHIGFGDCISGLVVAAYIAVSERELLSMHPKVLVPEALREVAQAIMAGTVISVEVDERERIGSFRRVDEGRTLMPRAPRNARELLKSIWGRETFLNWAEGCQLEVAGAKLWSTWGIARRARFILLQMAQFRGGDPRYAAPIYVGFRLLFPVLAMSSRTLTQHVFWTRATFSELRAKIRKYASSVDLQSSTATQFCKGKVIVFPGAESFNALPIDLCKEVEARFGSAVVFVLHRCDRAAQEAQLKLRNVVFVENIWETLALISRNFPIAVDSLVSHLIQLTTDDATIIFSRELRERFVHPGARPRTIDLTPECAPCAYTSLRKSTVCPVGRTTCVAFEGLYSELVQEILFAQRHLRSEIRQE